MQVTNTSLAKTPPVRQHFAAADGEALGVLVDDPRREEAVVLFARPLRAIRLWIDDHVGEVEIVVAGVAVIVRKRACASRVIGLEHVDAHDRAGETQATWSGAR